jgi:hypothetical protein
MIVAIQWRRTHQLTPEQIAQREAAAAEQAANLAASKLREARNSADIGAGLACQDAMRRRLKAPATAQFPLVREVDVDRTGDGKYSYRSYVDSQNSFGAMLRTQFSCDAETDDGENFTAHPHLGGAR